MNEMNGSIHATPTAFWTINCVVFASWKYLEIVWLFLTICLVNYGAYKSGDAVSVNRLEGFKTLKLSKPNGIYLSNCQTI